ncbi:SPOR domain-containing protein [Roseibium sp.]|uniref:D-alanyl-D-alanine carboxypeptidase n=1 Tax=Roseibium sp. TaxID=1936156 RepID=UPI003D0B1608
MRSSRSARMIGRLGKMLVVGTLVLCAPTVASANPKYAGIVVDAKTGKTLYAANADAYRFPASLTKIMTTYIIFEELEAGRLSMSSRLKVSKNAAAEVPSKLGLKPGSTISVKDAIGSLVTKSANDVATTVAENIAGSESAFARRMTRTARQLGMSKTTFRNAHGLPNSKQRTTARDMATLGRAIQERFPEYYKLFNTRVYKYKGRPLRNHNRLLGTVRGVDGIKTGYIRASGFNLVTSVKRDNRHIVAVVMGGRTGARRNAHMTDLIGRYLHKASKGRRTAPLIASAGPVFAFDAATLKSPPRPAIKPGRDMGPPVTGAPVVLASAYAPAKAPEDALAANQVPAPAPVPGFGNQVPIPPRAVKSRFNDTFAVATSLPPIPRTSPDASITTQSISKTALLQAARPQAGIDLPVRNDEQAPSAPIPVRTVATEAIEVIPAAEVGATQTASLSQKIDASSEELAQGDADENERVDVDTAEPAIAVSGWQVQIAAAETEAQAMALLQRAEARTGNALNNRTPFTEPVEANGTTLYRARFAGFDNKSAARRACRTLKKAKFACFAIYE